jgi:chromate transporter
MEKNAPDQGPDGLNPIRGLRPLLTYFLALGTFGFGGPIALAGYMQRDLLERRRWFTKEEYKEGLALAQLAPGPLAAQLAIYLGWVSRLASSPCWPGDGVAHYRRRLGCCHRACSR